MRGGMFKGHSKNREIFNIGLRLKFLIKIILDQKYIAKN